MGNAPARTGRRTRPVFSVFPETAATGDTFAACFAGTLAASSTVTPPLAVDFDAALVGLHDGLGQRQAQPDALGVLGEPAAVKPFEDAEIYAGAGGHKGKPPAVSPPVPVRLPAAKKDQSLDWPFFLWRFAGAGI